MAEIDVAVFAFDERGELQLTNRAGERLLGQPEPRLLGAERRGRSASTRACARTRRRSSTRRFPGGSGRWEIRHERLPPGRPAPPPPRARRRQPPAARGGAPGLAAPDPRARARAQQLARADPVDRREPARACSPSREPPPDWRDDMRQGLAVIASRSESLSRFTTAYAKLARLPRPASEGRRRAPARAGRRAWRRACRCGSRPGLPVASAPTRTSSSSSSSTSSATPSTPPSRRTGGVEVGWRRVGPGAAPRDLGRRRRARACRTPRTSSFPSSRPSRKARASASFSRARSPRPTAAALTLENRSDRPGCLARLTLPLAGG